MNPVVLTVVKRNPFVLPMAIVAALAMLFISEGSYWQSIDTLDDLGEMAKARTSIQRLERSLVDAETGQRGYLLTSHKEYLQPYEQAVHNVATSFEVLDHHFGPSPEPRAILTKLHTLADTKLSELAITIRLHDEGKREATTELVASGIGREKMEEMRTLTGPCSSTSRAACCRAERASIRR